MKNDKGFTLVELIVVLVILAILAAILLPALLGYIDRAKDQQYIVEARELMTATQAAIVEAYALHDENFQKTDRSKGTCPKISEGYCYVSSYLLATGQGTADSNKNAAKEIIMNRILEYTDSKKGAGQKYTFSNQSTYKGNFDISNLGKNEVSFVIMYSTRGKILYMQYARNGKLVTYDSETASYTVENGGKIVKY